MPNQQLIDYINQSLSQGQTKEQIKQNLLQAGWQESDIDEGMSVILPDKNISQKNPLTSSSKYQFKRPEMTNITKETIKELSHSWKFWIIVVTAITASIIIGFVFYFNIFGLTAFIVLGYIVHINFKVRKRFWKRFADLNGWQYEEEGNLEQESGIMFRQGDGKFTSNIIKGSIEERQFKIFNYTFYTGSGKNIKSHDYTVFAFKFNGSFPHIYLNSKYNSYGVNVGEIVPLPSEFEKKFTLSAPRKYEIEALEIFTPDVLVNLLDNGFTHDVEFVNSEVLIFTNGQINSFDKLEKEFKKALEIEDLLDEKLDKFKFTAIGDMPHKL